MQARSNSPTERRGLRFRRQIASSARSHGAAADSGPVGSVAGARAIPASRVAASHVEGGTGVWGCTIPPQGGVGTRGF